MPRRKRQRRALRVSFTVVAIGMRCTDASDSALCLEGGEDSEEIPKVKVPGDKRFFGECWYCGDIGHEIKHCPESNCRVSACKPLHFI